MQVGTTLRHYSYDITVMNQWLSIWWSITAWPRGTLLLGDLFQKWVVWFFVFWFVFESFFLQTSKRFLKFHPNSLQWRSWSYYALLFARRNTETTVLTLEWYISMKSEFLDLMLRTRCSWLSHTSVCAQFGTPQSGRRECWGSGAEMVLCWSFMSAPTML